MIDSQKILYSKGKNDECLTPEYAVKALCANAFGSGWEGCTIWCPFDKEDSAFVTVLRDEGFKVIHSHIDEGKDFFTYEPFIWDCIISNPPFTNKAKVFERALSFHKPFALLMSLTWLNDAAPKRLFKRSGLDLLMFEERIRYSGMGDKITFSSAFFGPSWGLFKNRGITMDSLKKYGMV